MEVCSRGDDFVAGVWCIRYGAGEGNAGWTEV